MKNLSLTIQGQPENAPYIGKQIWLAHKYRNAQVELQRRRMQFHDELLQGASPPLRQVLAEIKSAEEELSALRGRTLKARSEHRQTLPVPAEDAALIEALKTRLRELRGQHWSLLSELVAPLREGVKAAKQELLQRYQAEENEVAEREGRAAKKKTLKGKGDWRAAITDETIRNYADIEWSHAEAKNALNREYSALGLCWGSRGHVDQSLAPKKGKPPATNFRRWDGSGQLHIKFQGGISWDALLTGECSQCLASPRGKKFQLRLRGEKSRGEWFAVTLHGKHRLEPADKITDLGLQRVIVGGSAHWRLIVTTDGGATRLPADSGLCGLDVGWRLRPSGLRVAVVSGIDFHGQLQQVELCLPKRWLRHQLYAQELKSLQDLEFNAIKSKLRQESELPEEVAKECLPQCRSTAHLFRALRQWDDRPAWAEAWCRSNKRLYCEWSHLQRKFANRRKHLYRRFARWLADHFALCGLEELDLAKLKRNAAVEEEERNAPAKFHLQCAALGELRRYIAEALPVEKIDPKYSSQICNHCGAKTPASVELIHVCQACGTQLDQDALASTSLALQLARGRAAKDVLTALDPCRTTSYIRLWHDPNETRPRMADRSQRSPQLTRREGGLS